MFGAQLHPGLSLLWQMLAWKGCRQWDRARIHLQDMKTLNVQDVAVGIHFSGVLTMLPMCVLVRLLLQDVAPSECAKPHRQGLAQPCCSQESVVGCDVCFLFLEQGVLWDLHCLVK